MLDGWLARSMGVRSDPEVALGVDEAMLWPDAIRAAIKTGLTGRSPPSTPAARPAPPHCGAS
jgi:hypothetical protein